jgi:hypothetical protein
MLGQRREGRPAKPERAWQPIGQKHHTGWHNQPRGATGIGI